MFRKDFVSAAGGFFRSHMALRPLHRSDHVVEFDNLNDFYDVTLKGDPLRELDSHARLTRVLAAC